MKLSKLLNHSSLLVASCAVALLSAYPAGAERMDLVDLNEAIAMPSSDQTPLDAPPPLMEYGDAVPLATVDDTAPKKVIVNNAAPKAEIVKTDPKEVVKTVPKEVVKTVPQKKMVNNVPVFDVVWEPASGRAEQNMVDAMSLNEAVAIGLVTNPEYGVVANNRRATDEELNQAKALYYPSIDVRADTGAEHSDDPATRAGTDSNDEENLWRYEAGVTLTQLLFDGFETSYENIRQEERVKSAAHRVKETAELVGLSIVESYLETMRQRELLLTARQNVAEHISFMEQIQDSASAGRSTQADVEQMKARVASARAQESNVRQQLRFAKSTYKREVGDFPQNLQMPIVPINALEANVEEEIKTALFQSPTLDVFEADIKVAHAEYEGSKSTMYPQLDLQLNAREGKDLNGIRDRDTSASALVVLNWNLFRGGGDVARVREHINREAQAKESRVDAARSVETDVRQTWARMISAGERARQFSAQAAANKEVVRAYKDQFDLDRRTLLDVLDSQNEYFVSRSNTVNAEFVEMFAVYRLLALKAELLAVLGVDYPREADPAKL